MYKNFNYRKQKLEQLLQLPVLAEQPHLTHPTYRADIDGLRAIAVLSVVFFHAFPNVMRGGFVGVDIFFVISGYLISSIIFSSLERNCFSFIEFYSRRIRRIFPALLVVLMACLAFGWMALLSDEYRQLGLHTYGGASFQSNFVLWNEASYFDNAADTKPLLHLWSLGIEEQFYIVWPLLLWLAWKKRFNPLILTVVIAALSFAFNIAKHRVDTIADFYSPQTRFWELFAGSALAYITLYAPKPSYEKLNTLMGRLICLSVINRKILRDMQSMLGSLLLVGSIIVISKDWHFPGYWAILPVLGTVMIISAGTHAWVNRVVLRNRILVWFGLISFPLYVWHWPLLSFARIIHSEIPSQTIRIVLILISISLAWLTYWTVERPMRFGRHGKTKTNILIILMILIGYVGFKTHELNGLPFRIAAKPIAQYQGNISREEYLEYIVKNYHRCINIPFRELSLKGGKYGYRCFQSKLHQEIDTIIVGDSHADHLFPGLANISKSRNVAFFMQPALPLIDSKYFSEAFKFIIDSKSIKIVILSAYWKDKIESGEVLTKMELSRTIKALLNSNKHVYVVEDIPNYSFHPNRCKYQRSFSFDESLCTQPLQEHIAQKKTYSKVLAEAIANAKGAHFIPVDQYFCVPSKCSMVNNKDILYADNNHLNVIGSNYLGKMIFPIIYKQPFHQ